MGANLAVALGETADDGTNPQTVKPQLFLQSRQWAFLLH